MLIELFVASYILGGVTTWVALIPIPFKSRDYDMVAIAFVLGFFWLVMAADILAGNLPKDYEHAYGEDD